MRPAAPPREKRLLSRKEAAEFLGLAEKTLRTWAVNGYGVRFIKVGRRAMYRLSELERYISRRDVTNTGEASELA